MLTRRKVTSVTTPQLGVDTLLTMNIARFLLAFAAAIAGFAYAESYSKQHDEVQSFFQSDGEPTAEEAFWTASDMFNIGIVDDGSRRDDYARHACEVLYRYDFKGRKVWVMVFDVVDYSEQGKLKDLGSAQCQ